MKKELTLFSIDGSCGGNQDMMENPWMKLGGCAALAAVDTCLALTLHMGFSGLCPIDPNVLSWESYNRFAEVLRPYLSPRMMGVNRLSYFTDGFGAYLRDIGCHCLSMDAFPMGIPTNEARKIIITQIENGFPVPILHLNAKTQAVKEYQWHWFLLTGYEEENGTFQVKAVTFGEEEWLSFSDLWHEDDPDNGGLILYRRSCSPSPYEVVRTAAAVICSRPNCPDKVLVLSGSKDKPYLSFPGTELAPEENAEETLKRKLSAIRIPVTLTGLLAIHEYDVPPLHISQSCYKAVLSEGINPAFLKGQNLIWLSEEELSAGTWQFSDLPLINIIRSDMTDVEVIRKRIAEEEAAAEQEPPPT